MESRLLSMPDDFEIFTMTIDGGDPANDPLQGMIYGHGFRKEREWRHIGSEIKGKRTASFMWVLVGPQPNLKAVRKACLKGTLSWGKGKIPLGQWREEIIRRYDLYDECYRGIYRGIADPSWRNPNDKAFFPFFSPTGSASFFQVDSRHKRYQNWRWLMQMQMDE